MFAVVVALSVTASAAAQTPAPTMLRFDATDPPGHYSASLVQRSSDCTGQLFLSDTIAHSAPSFLFAPCRPTLRLAFAVPQASVELFTRALVVTAPELVATAHTVTGASVTVTMADPSTWRPVVLAAPGGAGSIDYVDLRAEGADIGVDDLAISSLPQPDTEVLSGPQARTEADQATFSFGANRPDIAGWRCALDGAALAACAPPVSYSRLAQGPHTFRVAAVDAYGAVDPSPTERAWKVLGPPPDTRLVPGAQPVISAGTVTIDFGSADGGTTRFECSVDGGAFSACTPPFTVAGLDPGTHTIDVRAVDADGRADPTPERFTFDVPGARSAISSGVSITDLDHDHIPDPEEILPLGNVPPLAGVRTLATLISGTVYVKLPLMARSGLQAGPLSGFVPLKGIAALPVGTIVDARRGALALQTSADGRSLGDRRRQLGRARLTAAIFQIRQARLRRAALRARPIPTDLVLISAPTAEIGCRATIPAKGVVRTLSASAKGLFRVNGGASRAEGRNAAWHTTDRCNGTVTRVTRGRVAVYDKARRRTVTVRAGQRYLARARLFQARKGRRPA